MTRSEAFRRFTVLRMFPSLIFLLTLSLWLTAAAQEAGDPEKGKSIYNRCKGCHQIGPEARNLSGPQLNGIIGRPVGAVEGYRYSKALSSHGGTWNTANLTAFLADPREAIKGTKMAFPGLKSAADIDNLLAYLRAAGE